MHKLKIVLAIMLVALLLAGCRSGSEETRDVSSDVETSAPNTANSSENVKSAAFDFGVPKGYEISNITENSCDIVQDGQVVGGFRLTDLDVRCAEDIHREEIFTYLGTLVTEDETFEYISDNWSGCTRIFYTITDLKTEDSYEEVHHLFAKDDLCYDLWLDGRYVDRDNTDPFLKAANIQ